MYLQKKTLTILLPLLLSSPVYSGDFDDGISNRDPINDDLKLEKNTNYTVRRALTKARVLTKVKNKNPNNKRIITNDGCNGTGNINLVATKLRAGTTIINNSDNTGTSSVCTQ
ncbi:MAG: hypothetical protein KAH08_08085 [Methylococcales bacterium]|nr:hypothetical protein [Methylococcales bacterium]MCK5897639.1 hypothetical protein [Methylococcales bacterium]